MSRNLPLDKNPERIGAMFNRIAPFYDFLNHFLSSGMDFWWRYQAVKSLDLPLGSFVVDLATGTGDLALSLLRLRKDVKIIGIDIAAAMLKRAAEKGKRYRNYHVVLGDGLNLPVKSDSLDGLMIAYGIRNMPLSLSNENEECKSVTGLHQIFREFRRVLKERGLLLILEFSLPSHPLARKLYLLYFQKVLPFLGNLISKDPEAYSYLPKSVETFVAPYSMADDLRACGFEVLKLHPFLGGVSYFITARKIT